MTISIRAAGDDIYYTLDDKLKGNMPHLVPEWLAAVQRAIPDYKPAIKSTAKLEPASISRNYFFKAYGMEALTFEIGDNTSRARIREKGEVGANALMTLMLEKSAP